MCTSYCVCFVRHPCKTASFFFLCCCHLLILVWCTEQVCRSPISLCSSDFQSNQIILIFALTYFVIMVLVVGVVPMWSGAYPSLSLQGYGTLCSVRNCAVTDGKRLFSHQQRESLTDISTWPRYSFSRDACGNFSHLHPYCPRVLFKAGMYAYYTSCWTAVERRMTNPKERPNS